MKTQKLYSYRTSALCRCDPQDMQGSLFQNSMKFRDLSLIWSLVSVQSSLQNLACLVNNTNILVSVLSERIKLTVSTEIDLTKIETTALKHQISHT